MANNNWCAMPWYVEHTRVFRILPEVFVRNSLGFPIGPKEIELNNLVIPELMAQYCSVHINQNLWVSKRTTSKPIAVSCTNYAPLSDLSGSIVNQPWNVVEQPGDKVTRVINSLNIFITLINFDNFVVVDKYPLQGLAFANVGPAVPEMPGYPAILSRQRSYRKWDMFYNIDASKTKLTFSFNVIDDENLDDYGLIIPISFRQYQTERIPTYGLY